MSDRVTQLETKSEMQPPAKPPLVATGTDFPDDITEIGDKIAALSPEKAAMLKRYLVIIAAAPI
jgi:hypothetical protein